MCVVLAKPLINDGAIIGIFLGDEHLYFGVQVSTVTVSTVTVSTVADQQLPTPLFVIAFSHMYSRGEQLKMVFRQTDWFAAIVSRWLR